MSIVIDQHNLAYISKTIEIVVFWHNKSQHSAIGFHFHTLNNIYSQMIALFVHWMDGWMDQAKAAEEAAAPRPWTVEEEAWLSKVR